MHQTYSLSVTTTLTVALKMTFLLLIFHSTRVAVHAYQLLTQNSVGMHAQLNHVRTIILLRVQVIGAAHAKLDTMQLVRGGVVVRTSARGVMVGSSPQHPTVSHAVYVPLGRTALEVCQGLHIGHPKLVQLEHLHQLEPPAVRNAGLENTHRQELAAAQTAHVNQAPTSQARVQPAPHPTPGAAHVQITLIRALIGGIASPAKHVQLISSGAGLALKRARIFHATPAQLGHTLSGEGPHHARPAQEDSTFPGPLGSALHAAADVLLASTRAAAARLQLTGVACPAPLASASLQQAQQAAQHAGQRVQQVRGRSPPVQPPQTGNARHAMLGRTLQQIQGPAPRALETNTQRQEQQHA